MIINLFLRTKKIFVIIKLKRILKKATNEQDNL
jgi:hypothetical protein